MYAINMAKFQDYLEKVMKLRREAVKVNDLGVGKLMLVTQSLFWGGLPRALNIWKRKVIT